ncbi:MAG: GntR family transcriptional regulator [SAR202 cluster bacterium]|nr:GntR family transcriptional regulator [SAR202 cluster bacterium]
MTSHAGYGRELRYIRVANTIRQSIENGSYPPGARLPAQHQLAAQQGVAFNTLRQALDLLDEQGYVIRRVGRGTYAAVPDLRQGSVLVLAFDARVSDALVSLLPAGDWEIASTAAQREAITLLATKSFSLVFACMSSRDAAAFETLAAIRSRGIEVPTVIVSPDITIDAVNRVLGLGPGVFLRAPIDRPQALQTLRLFARPRQRPTPSRN